MSSRPTCSTRSDAGFSRAGFNLDSSLLASFPSSLSFVTGAGPGGIVIGGGVPPRPARRRITSAGPNNAANVWNRRNLFTYTGRCADQQGNPPDQRRRLVSAAAGQRKHRFAPTRAGHLRQPDDFPARNREHVPGGAEPQRTGLEKPVRRLVFRRCHQAAAQSHASAPASGTNSPPAGTRNPGRAANYMTDANGRAGHQPAGGQFGLHAEQRQAAVQPARRPGLGPVRKREDCDSRGIRHLLFADRRSRFSAEFAASLQRLGLLLRRLVFDPAGHAGRPPPPSCGPGISNPAPPMPRRGAAQRENPDGSGMESHRRAAT